MLPTDIKNLEVGQKVQRNFSISHEDMLIFEKLSGDRNPIHMDKYFAAKAGFARPVVYGGLLIAKISELLGMWLPGPGCIWVGINLSFIKALFVDEPCILHGEIVTAPSSVGLMKITHVITRQSDIIARGVSEACLNG